MKARQNIVLFIILAASFATHAQDAQDAQDTNILQDVVYYTPNHCDHYMVDFPTGYGVFEWMGGSYIPSRGDIITGPVIYGLHNFHLDPDRETTAWVEEYLMSKQKALALVEKKCNR